MERFIIARKASRDEGWHDAIREWVPLAQATRYAQEWRARGIARIHLGSDTWVIANEEVTA